MLKRVYIIERASEMFVANGIKSVRVDDIAREKVVIRLYNNTS